MNINLFQLYKSARYDLWQKITLLKCAVMWENVNLFHSFYQCEIKVNAHFSVTALLSITFNIWVCLGVTVYNEKEENDNVITRIYIEREKWNGTRHEKSCSCYAILIS